jgi:hypothetical protein
MNRPYDTLIPTETATMFVGSEVEQTPMFGQRTLFVVGIQPLKDVIEAINDQDSSCQHVYLGANHSFEPNDEWDELVSGLLDDHWWVTLDFDIKYTEWVLENGWTENNKFIAMVSAKLPYIEQLGYNACLKLDDKDFDSTNPGVWTHRIHDLKRTSVFTDWSKYTQDKIIR